MRIDFYGTEEEIEAVEDMMTTAMMDCGRRGLGPACDRHGDDYCKFRCPFNEDGERSLLEELGDHEIDNDL